MTDNNQNLEQAIQIVFNRYMEERVDTLGELERDARRVKLYLMLRYIQDGRLHDFEKNLTNWGF